MKLEKDEVYTFKLTSGEELIAKVTAFDDKYIDINEPLSVAPGPQGMGLIQSVFTSEPGISVRLNINSITLFAQTEDKIKLKYIETTTGISVPSKKILVG